jgi:hypothetical protein
MSTSILRHPNLRQASIAQVAATSGIWQRVWAGIERHGQRRAAAELRRMAAVHAFADPELNRELLAAAARAERA